MPNWFVHVSFGVVVSFILFTLINYGQEISTIIFSFLLYVPIAIIYSQLPDADHPMSKISRFINIVSLVLILFLGVYFVSHNEIRAIIMIGLILLFLLFFNFLTHRDMLHSILAGIILALPLFIINWAAFVVGFVAFLSHLFLDGELSFI